MSMKNQLKPSGIEPTTLQFVAQRLNHCATAKTTWTGTKYTKVTKRNSTYGQQEMQTN